MNKPRAFNVAERPPSFNRGEIARCLVIRFLVFVIRFLVFAIHALKRQIGAIRGTEVCDRGFH